MAMIFINKPSKSGKHKRAKRKKLAFNIVFTLTLFCTAIFASCIYSDKEYFENTLKTQIINIKQLIKPLYPIMDELTKSIH